MGILLGLIRDLREIVDDLIGVILEYGNLALEIWMEKPMTFVIGAGLAIIFMTATNKRK